MIITGDDYIEKLTSKEILMAKFGMKDLEKLKYFLNQRLLIKKRIFIFQRKYVLDFLKEIGKLGCRILGSLIEVKREIFWKKTNIRDWQQILFICLFITHETRPIIANSINVVSQFMHDPRKSHMQEVDGKPRKKATLQGRKHFYREDIY